jgi:hypothetical protein
MTELQKLWTKEVQVYTRLYECWQNDTNILRKVMMPSLFVSYLLPMRFWNHFPYPSALACALSLAPFLVQHYQPELCSEELLTAYVALFIGPLFEAFLTGVMYYWIPGGRQALCSFFYSEDVFRLFVGNPISHLRELGAAALTVLTAKAVYVGSVFVDNYLTVEAAKTAHEVAKTAGQTKQINIEVAKSTNEAINQMVNAKVKTAKEAMGRDLTMEEVDNIFKQCKEDVNAAHTSKKTIVTGNLDLSSGKGGMNISHNGAGVNFQGSASVDSGLDVAKKMQQAHDQSGFGQEKK